MPQYGEERHDRYYLAAVNLTSATFVRGMRRPRWGVKPARHRREIIGCTIDAAAKGYGVWVRVAGRILVKA